MGIVRSIVGAAQKIPVIGKAVDVFDFSGTQAVAKEKAGRVAAGAAADQAAAKAASDADAAAKAAAADKQTASDQAAATIATNKDESRRAALSDMLVGEGDQNQRRRFLKGAK